MKFGVVLVTYNRLDKLKIALKCYDDETYKPKYILVVNNNSNDGTEEFLEKWKKEKSLVTKYVINLKVNSGGSGGFYEGLKKSLDLNADWIWVSDDDAYPKEDCFKIANDYLEENKADELSAICGKILNRGKIDIFHRRKLIKFGIFPLQILIPKREYKRDKFNLQLFSYVGTFISKEKMMEVGLTKKDYFIYNDDSEHSYRLSKVGKIVCLPSMEIIHDGPIVTKKDGITWKTYYSIRNVLDMIKSNFTKPFYISYKIYVVIKYSLMFIILYNNKKAGFQILKKAIHDADNNKLGIDDIYRPGWKPNTEKKSE